MSATLASEQPWMATETPTLVEINAALARLRRLPDSSIDEKTVEKARQLVLLMEHTPAARTPAAFAVCNKLLEAGRVGTIA